mmetsp:Transcript_4663/g.12503  ORF Transcript_4663/g.12503 Transcript_4663/m.12503 type:complete len:343 (+) Transcript_4663:234-1262(+)
MHRLRRALQPVDGVQFSEQHEIGGTQLAGIGAVQEVEDVADIVRALVARRSAARQELLRVEAGLRPLALPSGGGGAGRLAPRVCGRRSRARSGAGAVRESSLFHCDGGGLVYEPLEGGAQAAVLLLQTVLQRSHVRKEPVRVQRFQHLEVLRGDGVLAVDVHELEGGPDVLFRVVAVLRDHDVGEHLRADGACPGLVHGLEAAVRGSEALPYEIPHVAHAVQAVPRAEDAEAHELGLGDGAGAAPVQAGEQLEEVAAALWAGRVLRRLLHRALELAEGPRPVVGPQPPPHRRHGRILGRVEVALALPELPGAEPRTELVELLQARVAPHVLQRPEVLHREEA